MLDVSFCSKSIGLGFEISLPGESQRFMFGTKLKNYLNIAIYLGPFTIIIGREQEVLEYESEEVRDYYENVLE